MRLWSIPWHSTHAPHIIFKLYNSLVTFIPEGAVCQHTMVSEQPTNGAMSIVADENPIETHETEFSVGEAAVRIKIKVVTEFDARQEPHVGIDACVWVDENEVEDARVFSSGQEMFNIAFPPEHPLVEGHTRTSSLAGEYESNIVKIPQDYHQRTFKSYWDAHERLLAKKRSKIEQIDADVSIVETSIDEEILRAHTKLTSTLGSAAVRYSLNRAGELDWTVENQQNVPEDQRWLLNTAIRLLVPVDYDDYIQKVILNHATTDNSLGDETEEVKK